jgi:hypothetical protein
MALESGINSFRTVRLAALVANQIKGLIVDGYLDDAAGRKLVMPNGQQRHSGPPWKSPPRTLGTVGFGPKTANSCRFPFYARESIAFSADKRDRKKHSLLEGSFYDRGVVLVTLLLAVMTRNYVELCGFQRQLDVTRSLPTKDAPSTCATGRIYPMRFLIPKVKRETPG